MVSKRSAHRDLILDQLGITQYQLIRPSALQGEALLVMPATCKLIVIAPADFDIHTPLFQDILRAMALSTEQIFVTIPEHVTMLYNIQHYALFVIGEFTDNITLPANTRAIMCSDFTLLNQQAEVKKQLWQQICQHEHYFFS